MIQRIKVNLIPSYNLTLPVIHLKQYDQTDSGVGKQIELELYSGDDVYDIPSNAVVTFQGTKLDKTGYQYEVASYSGNLVTVDIKSQMTVLSGTHEAELRITVGDSIINTTRLVMDIDSAALADDTKISETELPMIEKVLTGLESKQDKLVSGTNIKTINNQSLLGSGNINISGGGGSGGTTDYNELSNKPILNGVELTGSVTITTVTDDAKAIAENTKNITANTSNIATNTKNIATNTNNISTVTSGLETEVSERKSADTTLQANIDKKQDTLVSGVTLKTINNASLLGSGNIVIEGGGGGGGTSDYNQLSNKPTLNGITLENDVTITTVSKDASDIATNSASIKTNADNITTNKSDISTLKTSVSSKAEQSDLESLSTTVSGKQDTLVSGTSIKTVNGTSILGSGNITTPNTTYSAVTTSVNGLMLATDKAKLDGVSEGANKTTVTNSLTSTSTTEALSANQGKVLKGLVDTNTTNISTNTSDIATNKTNISTNTTNIAKKQDALVSGTNIKTVNGNSLLGSGNLVISGGGGGATYTCTLGTSWTLNSTNGYYTQVVTLSGITIDDTPILDVFISGTLADMQARQAEWAKVVTAFTGSNTITFYASEATTTPLTIQVKMV